MTSWMYIQAFYELSLGFALGDFAELELEYELTSGALSFTGFGSARL